MCGGWPCFFVSLGMIGLLTAIVGDLATIFGCIVTLKDPVTGTQFTFSASANSSEGLEMDKMC